METIRKKICLENYRSRRQGLLPYIPFNTDITESSGIPFTFLTENDKNGNYGGFVIDLFSGDTYTNVIREYSAIMKELHAGLVLTYSNGNWVKLNGECKDIYDCSVYSCKDFVKIKKCFYRYTGKLMIQDSTILVVNNISVFDEVNDYKTFCKNVDKYLGELQIPSSIEGCLVPQKINLCDVSSTIEQMETDSKDKTNCCRLERYNNMGGDAMLAFLRQHSGDYGDLLVEINNEALEAIKTPGSKCIPYIEVPVLLNSDFSDIGIMKTYYDGEDEYEMPSGLTGEYVAGNGAYTESKLNEVRLQQYEYDDDSNVLPGLFESWPYPMYFTYEGDGVSGHWSEGSSSKDARGFYDVYTIRGSFPEPSQEGTTLTNIYAMTYKRNDMYHPMCVPYKEKKLFNIHKIDEVIDSVTSEIYDLMSADFVVKINKDIKNNLITFVYVCGGQFIMKQSKKEIVDIHIKQTPSEYELETWIPTTGILYKETYPFSPCEEMQVKLDGKEGVTIYYEAIDFESKEVVIKHETLNTKRNALLTSIMGYLRDDAFKNGDECFYNAPIYKEDYMMPISLGENTSIDVTVSRGNACAFEKHLKLSECNTMNDLINYSNNFFNL